MCPLGSRMSSAVSSSTIGLLGALLVAAQLAQAMPSRPLMGAPAAEPASLDGQLELLANADYRQLRQLAAGGPGAASSLRLRRQVANLLDRQLMQQQQAAAEAEPRARPGQQQQQQQRPLAGSEQSPQQLPLLLANQQLFEDEQTMRNQLPELIAQAHQDKTLERALLKMLINASLRSALGSMAPGPAGGAAAGPPASPLTAQQQHQLLANLDGANNWLDLDGPLGAGRAGQASGGEPQLRQIVGELVDQQQPLGGPGRQAPIQYSAQGLVDKREYIKPCSFNAISCVRTPFRKLLDREP